MDWHPGDRVLVCLPDKGGISGRKGSRDAWFSGTVRETDPPGIRPGVVVDLDHSVNGATQCFATHDELRMRA